MRADQIAIDYQIDFTSPFHLGSGLRCGLLHRGVVRDPDGFLFVPGSAVKGVTRHGAEQIANLFALDVREPHTEAAQSSEFTRPLGIVEDIFGSRTQPGTLWFDDARMAGKDRILFENPAASPELQARWREFQIEPRTRVHMSRLTGSAKPGHLFASEYGMRGLRFEGRVRGLLRGVPVDSTEDVTYPLMLLVASLLSVEALGGERSVGGGHCELAVTNISVNGAVLTPTRVLDRLGDLEYYEVART